MITAVLVGAGYRARDMFARPFTNEMSDDITLAGLYDHNPVRAKIVSGECGGIPLFDDFHVMLSQVKPDIVVVASTDRSHHTYIIAAMEAGYDVVSEKPMTIDAEKCRAIMEAERRTGRSVKVTFNLRFVPYFVRVKQLLSEGAIGKVNHIGMEWFLDRSHGADYYRRWHSQMENSGGMLVHKSTHHFDIANWWLGSQPEQVHAYGSLQYYGPNREKRGVRCLTCSHTKDCEYYFDMQGPFRSRFFLEAEKIDYYYRDRCVFGDHIDIYDNMSVHVRYSNGALLTYSLVTYSPFEGWRGTLTGSEGRMEIGNIVSGAHAEKSEHYIRVYKPNGERIEYTVPIASGGHGGGDERLRDMVFLGGIADPLGQQADSQAGAMSMLIGAAANRSIAEERAVRIDELMRKL
jgi:predicted dehydrogenase